GIAMVFSASGIRALDTVDDPRYYLGWQALWASIGLVGMLATMRVDYHRYRALAVPLVVIVVALLVAVLVPGVGVRAGGAARWLRAGAVAQPYRLARLVTFLDPWSDPKGAGFQAIQSLYGLALGGVFGEGLGAGREKFGFLPAPYTDSIFAVLGDELGLAGTLVVIVLFFAIAYRGIAIALRAKDSTGALLAAGVTTWLVFQAWVNMAVVASLVPMTGITLP